MNTRDYKFLIFCLAVVLASTFLLTGCLNRGEQEEVIEEEVREDVVEEIFEEEAVTTGDFSKFSNQAQEIGELSGENYEITFFAEKPMNGYHSFVFEVEGGEELPKVLAQYRPESGSIRLTFQEIEENKVGPRYQRAYDINEKGVVRIYHNISPDEGVEIYDIGVVKSTDFYLYGQRLEDEKWEITLDVRYPGESNLSVDEGSDEFDTEEQRISGATSSDGARITNYSYTIEGQTFRFIWTVRGSEESPIPEVQARYNRDGDLTVTFPDLDSDTIGRDAGEMALIGGLEKVVWNRSGNESIYKFVIGEEKNYRLRSFLNPHQVVLEVEL